MTKFETATVITELLKMYGCDMTGCDNNELAKVRKNDLEKLEKAVGKLTGDIIKLKAEIAELKASIT